MFKFYFIIKHRYFSGQLDFHEAYFPFSHLDINLKIQVSSSGLNFFISVFKPLLELIFTFKLYHLLE